jgi:Ca2+-binding EF-hand superfamily protein
MMKTTHKVTLATVLGLGLAGMTLPVGAFAQGMGMQGDRDGHRDGGYHGGYHDGGHGFMHGDRDGGHHDGGYHDGGRGFMRGDRGGFDFGALDTDGDGRITTEEMAERRAAAIQGIDADADGLLSADEIAAFQVRKAEERANARATRMVETLDSDGDGKISAAEMMMAHSGGSPRMFDRLDANKDGAITQEEIDQRRAERDEWRERRGDRDGDRGWGHRGQRGGGQSEGATPEAGK